jgi:zinc protease
MQFPSSSATTHVLPNSLTLILDASFDHPVISVQFWVETGSIHEDRMLGSGLSHFLEHMVFKGTHNFDGDTLAETVQSAGGHWNAYTSFDRTVYYIDGPAKGTNRFLEVLSDLVFRPLIPEKDFLLEKDVIRREIDMGLDDPDNISSRLLFSSIFLRDARRYPVIGERSLFDQIQYENLISYHKNRYTTNRSCVVVAGDFSSSEVIEKITELTKDLQPNFSYEPSLPCELSQSGLRHVKSTFAIPNSRVTMAWKIPSIGDDDAPAYDVLAAMLGRGNSSFLYQQLREKKELAIEISSWSWTGNMGEGIFAVSAEAKQENVSSLIASIFSKIVSFSEMKFDHLLSRAKRQISVSQFRSLTTISGRASDLGSNWHEARDLNFTRTYLERIQAVTVDDVVRVIKKLGEKNATITELNPLSDQVNENLNRENSSQIEPSVFTLANGIRVAIFSNPRSPLVSVQCAVRSGLSYETIDKAGINSLVSSTITQGTKSRNALEIATIIESLGASLGASAGNNSITVGASCLSEDIGRVVEIFADVIKNPIFSQDVMLREKASQLSFIQEALEDPLSVAFQSMCKSLFENSTYGIPSSGTESSMQNIRRDDLIEHHQRYFHGANMTLVVVGNIDLNEIKKLIEFSFSDVISKNTELVTTSSIATGKIMTNHLSKKQAALAIGFPGLAVNDTRRFALQMIQEYSSGMAGPLFIRIREELGLAYQVGATHFLGHDAGMIAFYMATSPAQLELATQEMLLEIQKIAKQGIPDEKFESVRATVLSGLILQQQSPSSIAKLAAIDLLFGASATYHREQYKYVNDLTPEKVRELARELFDGVKPTISSVTQANVVTV